VIEYGLQNDPYVDSATDVLNDPSKYVEILSVK